MQQRFKGDSFQRINHLLPVSASSESHSPSVIDPSETYYIRDYIPNPTYFNPSLDDHANDYGLGRSDNLFFKDFLETYEGYPSSSDYVTAGPSNALAGSSNAIAGPSNYQNTSSTASSVDFSYLTALDFDQPVFTNSYAAIGVENGVQFGGLGGLGTSQSTNAVDYSTALNFLSWDEFEEDNTVTGMAMDINESK